MNGLTRANLLAFMRQQKYGVQASVSVSGTPQIAVIGVVVSDQFEVFFDTLQSTRAVVDVNRSPPCRLSAPATGSSLRRGMGERVSVNGDVGSSS